MFYRFNKTIFLTDLFGVTKYIFLFKASLSCCPLQLTKNYNRRCFFCGFQGTNVRVYSKVTFLHKVSNLHNCPQKKQWSVYNMLAFFYLVQCPFIQLFRIIFIVRNRIWRKLFGIIPIKSAFIIVCFR